MTKRTKQLLSLLLVLIMMVALFPTAVLAASKPTITQQPTAKLGAPGGMVRFTIKATGATSYQWQYRRSSTDTWKNSPADGNRTNTLQVSVEKNKNGYFYRCRVSNSAGSVFSNPAKLNVNKPVIQTHPTAKLADFSDREYEKYFLFDIVHFGWTGWIDVEEAVYNFAMEGV